MTMTTEDILSYIRTREVEGANDVDIDNELMGKGCTEEQIDNANDIYCHEWKSL